MIKYTAQNPYERFPDGRPKVPDALLEKVKGLSRGRGPRALRAAGIPNQFVDGLQLLHPGKKLVGRAVTLQLMPIRADVADAQAAEWKAKGDAAPLAPEPSSTCSQPGDVLVVDVGGNIGAGGIVGDNLAYYIWKTTGAGFVIDGAIRDLEGVAAVRPGRVLQGRDAAGDPQRHGDRHQRPRPHRQHDGAAGRRGPGRPGGRVFHPASPGEGRRRRRRHHAHSRRVDEDEVRRGQVQVERDLQHARAIRP